MTILARKFSHKKLTRQILCISKGNDSIIFPLKGSTRSLYKNISIILQYECILLKNNVNSLRINIYFQR